MNQIIMYMMAAGALLGGLDRIFGNRLGLGKRFEEGFNLLGPIALGQAGIICLAPVLSNALGPIVSPGVSCPAAGSRHVRQHFCH